MLPISGSRKIAGIYKQIGQTADRISLLCEELGYARSDCAMASWDGDNEEAVEAERIYHRKLRALTSQVNFMTRLGEQLNEEIHKAD